MYEVDSELTEWTAWMPRSFWMNPSKGEVWLVNLDPTLGDEIRKMRPVIVVSRDALAS